MNPYIVPAFIFLVSVLLGCGVWAVLACTRQPAAGRHARRAVSAEAARPGTYPRGEPEPAEGQPAPYQPGDPHEPGEPDWWDEQPPQPPAVEILTGPGAPVRQTSEVTIGVLARVRDKLLPDAWRPEPGEAAFTPADPAATMTDLPAVEASPQYLAAPQ